MYSDEIEQAIEVIKGTHIEDLVTDATAAAWDELEGGGYEIVVDEDGVIQGLTDGYDGTYEAVYFLAHRIVGRETMQGDLIDEGGWTNKAARGCWEVDSPARIGWLAGKIYYAVDGADDKAHKATLTQEIADWLRQGDGGVNSSVAELAAEWREYQADAVDNGTD